MQALQSTILNKFCSQEKIFISSLHIAQVHTCAIYNHLPYLRTSVVEKPSCLLCATIYLVAAPIYYSFSSASTNTQSSSNMDWIPFSSQTKTSSFNISSSPNTSPSPSLAGNTSAVIDNISSNLAGKQCI